MTDTQDLIAELRKDAHHHIDGQMAGLMDEAADALEAAQAEVERLERIETALKADISSICGARDAALARLAALEHAQGVAFETVAAIAQGCGMTDRELLELAAKAAGVVIYKAAEECVVQLNPEHVGGFAVENARGGHSLWNPLTDDGDALRLAVKLNLHDAIKLAHRLLGGEGCECMYAATRRAIVLAAAEIGRAMA